MKKKVCLYVEKVVPEYDNITFRRLFRLKRSSVEILFQEIMAEDSLKKVRGLVIQFGGYSKY